MKALNKCSIITTEFCLCLGDFLKTESLVQGTNEMRIMDMDGQISGKKKISIRGPLEVLRSNDFPNPLTRCKTVGLGVNQNFELLRSVFKFLENGFVIEQAWRRSKTFRTLQQPGAYLEFKENVKQELPCQRSKEKNVTMKENRAQLVNLHLNTGWL